MSEPDDDIEPLLEGSELEKYLRIHLNQPFDVFTKETDNNRWEHLSSTTEYKAVDDKEDNHELISLLLHCNLMLEEDAYPLYSLTIDHSPEDSSIMKSRVFKKSLIGSGWIIVLCGSFLVLKPYKIILLPFLLGASSVALLSLYHTLKKSRGQKKLAQLLSILNKISYTLKKSIRNLKDVSSCVTTKELVMNFKKIDSNLTDYYLQRAKKELQVFTEEIIAILLALITSARSVILSLTNTSFMGSRNSYIAHCTDKELGIDVYTENCLKAWNLHHVEALNNLYLLIQSECLRAIGIYLWKLEKESDKNYFDSVLSQYTDVCDKNLAWINTKSDLRLFTYKTSKSKIQVIDDNLIDIYPIVHKLNSSLVPLLINAGNVEEYITQLTNVSDINFRYLELNIRSLDESLEDCYKQVKKIRVSLNKLKKSNDSKTDDVPMVINSVISRDAPVNKTGITVGKSDFGINDLDNVYLGVTESDESGETCFYDVDSGYFNQPKYPSNLLPELKLALVPKRDEFNQREIEAAQRVGDYDKYIQFSETLDVSNSKDTITEKKPRVCIKSDVSIPLSEEVSNESLDLPHHAENLVPSSAFDLQKSIAAKAVNVSLLWDRHQEEVFCAEDDSSEESMVAEDNTTI